MEAQRGYFYKRRRSWDTNDCQRALNLRIQIPPAAIIPVAASKSQSGSEARPAQDIANA